MRLPDVIRSIGNREYAQAEVQGRCYYTPESISRVRRAYAWELDHFGYSHA